MKKLSLFFIILTMAVFSAFSLDSSLDVGVNISYNNDSALDGEDFHSGLLKKMALGLEVRTNISNFQTTVNGDLSVLDAQSLMFSGIFGAGLAVDLFEYFKFGVTLGPKVTYVYSNRVQSVDGDGTIKDASSLWDAMLEGDFHYRLMLDFLAGPVMSIGFEYTIPTSFSIRKWNVSDLFPSDEMKNQGQIAFYIGMKVI